MARRSCTPTFASGRRLQPTSASQVTRSPGASRSVSASQAVSGKALRPSVLTSHTTAVAGGWADTIMTVTTATVAINTATAMTVRRQ